MGRQSGTILIYALLALFVATAAGAIVYTYSTAIARAEKAEAAERQALEKNDELLADNTFLRQDNAHKDKLLAQRQAQRNANDATERGINAVLEEIRSLNQDVRAWASQPVPADVLIGLRNERGAKPQDGKVHPAGKPAGGSAGSGVAGEPYQLGPARTGPRLSPPAAGMQR